MIIVAAPVFLFLSTLFYLFRLCWERNCIDLSHANCLQRNYYEPLNLEQNQ